MKEEVDWSLAIDAIEEGIFLIDAEHNILAANNAFAELVGRPKEKIIGRECYAVVHGTDAPVPSCPHAETLKTKKTASAELKEPKLGSGVFLFTTYPVLGRAGDLRFMVHRIGDITRHKETEEALQESEERYRAILQSAKEAIISIDRDARIISWNKSAGAMFGYGEEEVLGRPLVLLMPEGLRKNFEDRFKGGVRPGPSKEAPEWVGKTYEFPGLRKNGTEFLGEISLGAYKSGKEVFYTGIVRDITEQKKAEEALRQSEERYRTLVEASSQCICNLDLNGNFTYMNPAGLKLHSKRENDVIGVHYSKLVKPAYTDLLNKMLEKAKAGETMVFQYEIDASSGEKWLESTITPVRDGSGRVVSLLRISRDVTEHRRVEEEMKRRLMKYRLDEGSMYLVKEPGLGLALAAFNDLLNAGYTGLIISRTGEKEFSTVKGGFEFYWLAEKGGEKTLPPDLKEITGKMEKLPRRSAVLIDRLDYLIFKNGFKKTLSFVHRLRELAYTAGYIVILSIDPGTLSGQRLRALEKETMEIEPLRKVELDGKLLEVLKFVYWQNMVGVKPSYTAVGRELGLSKPTVRKRMRFLLSAGYVKVTMKGRDKLVELSEKGMSLLSK